MKHDPIFDSDQNKALLVVCARKTIRTTALLGIVWGCINLVIGYFAVQRNVLNAGILALGLLMLGTGMAALRKPMLESLLSEAVVSALLFIWNMGTIIMNIRAGTPAVGGYELILPAIATIVFYRQYKRLGHLKDAIACMDHATIKEAAAVCRQIFKRKLKRSPDVIQNSSKRCRFKLMGDSVLCVQKNLARAFRLNRTDFQQCIMHPEKKRLRVVVRHPLGKLTYAFDRHNSAKIKSWLGTAVPPA